MPRISWKKAGRYEKLEGLSLDAWLLANHLGRAPTELVPEIGDIVGHKVTLQQAQHACQRLKLRTSGRARSKGLRAAARVRAIDPVPQPDPNAIWAAAQTLQARLEYMVSEVNEIDIDLRDQTKPIAIVEMADLHLGGIGTDMDAIDRDANLIAQTDGMYCVIGGDNVDNFLQAFLMSAMAGQVITASPQWLLFERYLSIIQAKILYARVGNHDAWTQKLAQVDKFGELMGKFKVLNVKHVGVAHIYVGTQEYVLEATHKWWGNSKLNDLHSAMRLLDFGVADGVDIAVVEHRHTPAAGWQNRRGKRRFLIRAGTYKTRDKYSAEHGFWGAEVAPACLVYWPDRHEIAIFHNVSVAAGYLTYLRSNLT